MEITETGFRAPRYVLIAVDIAQKIVQGVYSPGEKLHGRSTLAGIYRVSPETIRKAVALLAEAGVLKVIHGTGIIIQSTEAAEAYVVQADYEVQIRRSVAHFYRLLEEHKRLGIEMEKVLTEIINYLPTN